MGDLKTININDYKSSAGSVNDIVLTYQIFGQQLHKAPVVLVNHALTGNSQVIGDNGWWNDIIGENKVIDTNTYSIIAFNIPGNGFDGVPSNLIHNYKDYLAKDIAKLFLHGLEALSINEVYAVIGGSIGGGIAWELAVLKPKLFKHIIPIASDWKSTDWLIANCYIQERLLEHSSDPVADARLHAMTLYRTPESFSEKFNRTKANELYFNVETWLDHHGKKLTGRFELAAYKMMNQILKTIDITRDGRSFLEIAKYIESEVHLITINSDLFFKSKENWDTFVELKTVKNNVSIGEIKSIHGHDAFLIEYQQLIKLLKPIFRLKVDSINDLNTTILMF